MEAELGGGWGAVPRSRENSGLPTPELCGLQHRLKQLLQPGRQLAERSGDPRLFQTKARDLDAESITTVICKTYAICATVTL